MYQFIIHNNQHYDKSYRNTDEWNNSTGNHSRGKHDRRSGCKHDRKYDRRAERKDAR